MKINLMIRQRGKGFTIIELLIAIAIFAIVIAALFSTYVYFIHSTARESALATINADVETTLKLLERDIKMAGFGLPRETRVASHDQCNVKDEKFCKENTDRIFVADGWEILRDFTDDQRDDGSIPTTPTDYYSRIANSKADGGYRAELASRVSKGASSITVYVRNRKTDEKKDTLDIDFADLLDSSGNPIGERSDPDADGRDIKDNKAFIITDGTSVEGHRIESISGTTINLLSKELIDGSYPEDSQVVPAIAWYVRKDPDGKKYPNGKDIYWLYRNENRVIPYVEDFQIKYGYDAYPNDPVKGGIQEADWRDTIPPKIPYPDGASSSDPRDLLRYLRAIQITITIKVVDKKDPNKVILTNFERIVDLKN